MARERSLPSSEVLQHLEALQAAIAGADRRAVRDILTVLIASDRETAGDVGSKTPDDANLVKLDFDGRFATRN